MTGESGHLPWRRPRITCLISRLRYDAFRVYFAANAAAGRLAMVGRLHGLRCVGRQLAAAVLVFALLLQGIVFAFASGRLAAIAAGDGNRTGFELCLHDTSSADQLGGAPERPDTEQHCVFCLAGATYVLGALASAPAFHTIAFATASWPFVAWRLPAATVDASARPRGPPLAA
jgi:hypothetical protein